MERLKELRRERVLSLRELEERSGVSYNTIWRIEDGRQGRTRELLGSWPKLWACNPLSSLGRARHGQARKRRRGHQPPQGWVYMARYTVQTPTGSKRKTLYE